MILCTSRWSVIARLTIAIGASASLASAQTPLDDGSGLLFGPLTLRPVIVLRDAGIDSNVFNLSGEESEDRIATASATTGARMRVGMVRIDGTGGAEYLYFERYTSQRGVNHFATLRLEPQLARVRPFVGGGYRRTRDRANSEIDVRAPRTEHEYTGGVDARLTPRGTLQASWRRSSWRFDEGQRFRDIDLSTRLNRDSDTADVSFRYELSPLTTFTVGTSLTRDRFTESADFDSDGIQMEAGFVFAPDAVVRGRAVAGIRDQRPQGARSVPSRGPTAGVELSYTLFDRTIFQGRFSHERMISAESHPYYVQTATGLEVTHNLLGPLDLIARAGRVRLSYDELPAFNLPAHLDRINTVGAGVALRLGSRARIAATYDETRRRSNASYARDYDRRQLFTTVSYGF